jgi:hypothetical protein
MSEEKEDLIVDNPLLLTSLFKQGIFLVPTDKRQEFVPQNKQAQETTSVESKPETGSQKTAKEPMQSAPIIPQVDVIHLVVEEAQSAYREVVIPNTMKALTNIQSKWGRSYEIIDVKQMGLMPKEYIQLVPEQVKIVFWGKETSYASGLSANSHRLLLLSMPSVMLASQESKTEHWNQIKRFFGQG